MTATENTASGNSGHGSFGAKKTLTVGSRDYTIFGIDTVEGSERLPFSLKVLLENLLRTEDGANIVHRPFPGTIWKVAWGIDATKLNASSSRLPLARPYCARALTIQGPLLKSAPACR